MFVTVISGMWSLDLDEDSIRIRNFPPSTNGGIYSSKSQRNLVVRTAKWKRYGTNYFPLGGLQQSQHRSYAKPDGRACMFAPEVH